MNNGLKITLGIVGMAAFTFGLLEVVRRAAKGFSKRDKTPKVMSYTKKTLANGIIVTVPDTKFAKYDLVVVFGGMHYANPEWMLQQIPEELLYSNIFVIAPYTVSFVKLKPIYESYFATNKIQIADKSIMGFSAGGINVHEAYSPEWKFVGLIDPSTRVDYGNRSYGKNTFMSYNIKNWAGVFKTFDYKAVYPKVEQSIKNSGGFTENISNTHADFPKYFMQKFSKQINKA